MKWLVLTIGGTSKIAVDSIKAEPRPDRAYFMCSAETESVGKGSALLVQGKGNVCKSRRDGPVDLPSIPVQAGLSPEQWALSRYDLNADDLEDCYLKSVEAFTQIRQEDPRADIYADYTGGTKSMVVGLAMAALDDGRVKLVLVAGSRGNLELSGDDDIAIVVSVARIVHHRAVLRARAFTAKYDYGAAAIVFEKLAQETHRASMVVHLHSLCLAFDAWDRFDHQRAFTFLDTADKKGEYGRFRAALKPIVTALSRTEADGTQLPVWKTHAGYLLAADILANGKRRAARQQYDDAIARDYRACELVAQTELWTAHEVDAGNVRMDQVPEGSVAWRDTLKNEPALGFLHSWELLAVLNHDLGQLWLKWQGPVRHAMERRNYSLLAHGTRLVTQSDYDDDMSQGMGGFATAALDALAEQKRFDRHLMTPDFPTDFPGE